MACCMPMMHTMQQKETGKANLDCLVLPVHRANVRGLCCMTPRRARLQPFLQYKSQRMVPEAGVSCLLSLFLF